jgi:CheY-like chemotaxis protein
MRVIHVEDDPQMRDLMQEWARREYPELTLESVCEGKAAHDRILEESYDYVITDCAMPQLTGVELAQKLAERDCDVPTVFYTSHLEPDDMRTLRDTAMEKVFIKGRDGCKDVLSYVVARTITSETPSR